MMDVAREQSPREAWLLDMLSRSKAAGYNAVGLYLEHRYAYPSAPWAAADGALTPGMIKRLTDTAKRSDLRLIPFLNSLGHMEGFIRSEGGQWLAEGPGQYSLQLCPSRKECVDFARSLIADAIDAFDDEWVHIGGDEAKLLGYCPLCAARTRDGGAARLYGEYYADLCRWVLERGRRPAIWGDMLLKHPQAMDKLPPQTLIFDWQYFHRPRESAALFRSRGFDVVCCPSVQTYNSGWCFLDETQRNIDEHAEDAAELGALGVLVTTWEQTYFTNYEATMPLVYAAGRRLGANIPWDDAIRAEAGDEFLAVASWLGREIPAASAFIAPGTWRHLRERLIMRDNPFELWRYWRDDACGAPGDRILELSSNASAAISADHPLQFPILLHRIAVEFVRAADRAAHSYAARHFDGCDAELRAAGDLLETLRPGLIAAADAGGSSADPHRLTKLIERTHAARSRVAALKPTSLHLPAFETLLHNFYTPNAQAAWRTGDDPPPAAPVVAEP